MASLFSKCVTCDALVSASDPHPACIKCLTPSHFVFPPSCPGCKELSRAAVRDRIRRRAAYEATGSLPSSASRSRSLRSKIDNIVAETQQEEEESEDEDAGKVTDPTSSSGESLGCAQRSPARSRSSRRSSSRRRRARSPPPPPASTLSSDPAFLALQGQVSRMAAFFEAFSSQNVGPGRVQHAPSPAPLLNMSDSVPASRGAPAAQSVRVTSAASSALGAAQSPSGDGPPGVVGGEGDTIASLTGVVSITAAGRAPSQPQCSAVPSAATSGAPLGAPMLAAPLGVLGPATSLGAPPSHSSGHPPLGQGAPPTFSFEAVTPVTEPPPGSLRAPTVPLVPEVPEVSQGLGLSLGSLLPGFGGAPQASQALQLPQAVRVPEVPERVPQVPEVVSQAPERVPQAPLLPQAVWALQASQAVEVPQVPQAGLVAQVTQGTGGGSLAAPGARTHSGVPGALGVPGAPGAPGAFGATAAAGALGAPGVQQVLHAPGLGLDSLPLAAHGGTLQSLQPTTGSLTAADVAHAIGQVVGPRTGPVPSRPSATRAPAAQALGRAAQSKPVAAATSADLGELFKLPPPVSRTAFQLKQSATGLEAAPRQDTLQTASTSSAAYLASLDPQLLQAALRLQTGPEPSALRAVPAEQVLPEPSVSPLPLRAEFRIPKRKAPDSPPASSREALKAALKGPISPGLRERIEDALDESSSDSSSDSSEEAHPGSAPVEADQAQLDHLSKMFDSRAATVRRFMAAKGLWAVPKGKASSSVSCLPGLSAAVEELDASKVGLPISTPMLDVGRRVLRAKKFKRAAAHLQQIPRVWEDHFKRVAVPVKPSPEELASFGRAPTDLQPAKGSIPDLTVADQTRAANLDKDVLKLAGASDALREFNSALASDVASRVLAAVPLMGSHPEAARTALQAAAADLQTGSETASYLGQTLNMATTDLVARDLVGAVQKLRGVYIDNLLKSKIPSQVRDRFVKRPLDSEAGFFAGVESVIGAVGREQKRLDSLRHCVDKLSKKKTAPTDKAAKKSGRGRKDSAKVPAKAKAKAETKPKSSSSSKSKAKDAKGKKPKSK